jgi:hypothetical protein
MSRPIRGNSARFVFRFGIRIFAILISALTYPVVRPAFADVAVGAASGDFLSFEVGGRSAGMAGAHTGVATGVTAQFWNPAGLATLSQPQVGAMHANWLQDLSYEWLGIAKPMGKLGVGSLSVAYFHTPGIQGVDEFDNPTGSFQIYDVAVTAGLARQIAPGLSIGANAKMIRQSLGTVSAAAPAFDFGARGVFGGTSIGAAVQNLGPGLSFDGGSSYPLPRQLKFGIGRGFLGDRVQLAADYNIPSDYFRDLRVGTELRAHHNVSLRLGYRREFGSENDPATGLSCGLGIHFSQLELDYSMTPSNQFDDVHRLSFGYSFGSGSEEKKPEKPKPVKQEPPPPPAPAGPRVIASAKPSSNTPASVAAPSKSAPAAPSPVAPASARAVAQVTPVTPVATIASAPAPSAPAAPTAAKPAKAPETEYVVVLPGYWSKDGAQAELRALELLGFRTKDAVIEKAPQSGYQVRLARMRSKSGADDMASNLGRMSFRAVVQTVDR